MRRFESVVARVVARSLGGGLALFLSLGLLGCPAFGHQRELVLTSRVDQANEERSRET